LMTSSVESGKTSFSDELSFGSDLTGGAVAGIGDPSVNRRLGAFGSEEVAGAAETEFRSEERSRRSPPRSRSERSRDRLRRLKENNYFELTAKEPLLHFITTLS
jgi:hypothetical protein